MAASMVSRASPSFLALVILALLVSSCHASRDNDASVGDAKQVDPKCEQMTPCTDENCTIYCTRFIGLNGRGFCTFKDLNFYCCCPIDA
ncbi:hypothetical protein ACP4OV_001169 [Aristida adscensionis]